MSMRLVAAADPVLRAVAPRVDDFGSELAARVADLQGLLLLHRAAGVAAPQVGWSARVIVIAQGEAPLAMVNPVVLDARGSCRMREGCLSLPGLEVLVERPKAIELAWQDVNGEPRRAKFTGLQARAVQHEIDHLDGLLMTDRAAAA